MISANVDLGTLLKRLRKVPREAAAIIEKAIDTDAKGFVVDIVSITPPYYRAENPPANNSGTIVKPPSKAKLGKEAKQRGESAINRDVRRVYGNAGDLYPQIKTINEKFAAAFWKAANLKNWRECDRICRLVGVPLLTDLTNEDGTEHQRRRSRRDGRVNGLKQSMFVRENRSLKAYIKSSQSRVGYLAAGFKPAAARLGVSLPKWVQRHQLQAGSIRIHRAPGQYGITISNNSRYARNADLTRRIKWVLGTEKRKKRLQNSIRYGIRAALKKSQLTLA